MRRADLDDCNGKTVDGSYRYYMTPEPPYIVGCFRGTPASIKIGVQAPVQVCLSLLCDPLSFSRLVFLYILLSQFSETAHNCTLSFSQACAVITPATTLALADVASSDARSFLALSEKLNLTPAPPCVAPAARTVHLSRSVTISHSITQ
jgi:hypothetical protein